MPTTMDNVERAQRKARCIELRRQRWHWDAIGRELGISKTRAHQIYNEALAEYPVAKLAEHRHEELELIDQAVSSLLSIATANPEDADPATGKAVSARTRVEAWSAVRGWAEHRSKLLGLYAPTRSQVDIVTRDSITAEMERLAGELGGSDVVDAETVDDEQDVEGRRAIEAAGTPNDV